MKILINNQSMVPIYEQIVDQIKMMIVNDELAEGELLPSVRSLSKDLKISALTVKKAYDNLEKSGYTVTVHGKGTFITQTNKEVKKEEQIKEVEETFKLAINKAKQYKISEQEIREIINILLEE